MSRVSSGVQSQAPSGYAGIRRVISAPQREPRRGQWKWVQYRPEDKPPEAGTLVEVRTAVGSLMKGRAGDLLWNLPITVPGRIVAYRRLG